jgi:hypothetical protein
MAHGSAARSRDRADTGRVLAVDSDDRTRVVRPLPFVGCWIGVCADTLRCSAVSQKGRLVEYVAAALKPTDVSEGEVASTFSSSINRTHHLPTLRRTIIRRNQRSLYIPLPPNIIRLPPFRLSLPHHRRQRAEDPGVSGDEEVGSKADGYDSAECRWTGVPSEGCNERTTEGEGTCESCCVVRRCGADEA